MDNLALSDSFGDLLRSWRRHRRYSQLQLSSEIGVSSRHLSFLENGRSNPSRDMVLRLALHLSLPRAETNRALLSAGYSPEYVDLSAGDSELAPVVTAIERLLRNHSPFPALILDARWNLVNANPAAVALMEVTGYRALAGDTEQPNMIEALIADDPATTRILNWDEVVLALYERLAADVEADPTDTVLVDLADRLRDRHLVDLSPATPNSGSQALIPTRVRGDGVDLAFFSILSSFDSIRDVTMSGLTAELMFPLDEATERYIRRAEEAR